MNKEQQDIYNDLTRPESGGKTAYSPMTRDRFQKLLEFQSGIESLPILMDVKPKYKNLIPYKKVKRGGSK